MISLQSKIKIYIVFSIMIYIISAVSIFMIDLYLSGIVKDLNQTYPELSNLLNKVYIFVIIITLGALVFGVFTLVFTYIRGLNKYREISRRLAGIDIEGEYALTSIEFPKEDEFGNLGSQLNHIVMKLSRFDDLKTARLQIEKDKFQIIANKFNIPLMMINLRKSEKIIKFVNEKFMTTFAAREKGGFFADFTNNLLSALHIQNGNETKPVEKVPEPENLTRFVDGEFQQAVDLAITNKDTIVIKKELLALNGKDKYYCDNVEITPVISSSGQVMDILILFDKIKKK